MFDTNVTIVTETDMAAQKREWLTVDAQLTPIRLRTKRKLSGIESLREFCSGWRMYQRCGQKLPAKFAFTTLDAQAGWEEAHGAATAVKFPRWAVTFTQGWDVYRHFRPVGAIIRSNEALRGWKAAREDHLAWDVDKWEVTL